MSATRGASTGGIIIITSIISILITIIIGMVIISMYGKDIVAEEVSPFIDTARDRITEGVVPPSERTEPDTEADVIMDGVAKNQGSSVLIYVSDSASAEFLGRGILVTSNGYIITDAAIVNASSTYYVSVPGTKDRFVASVEKVENDLAVLKITISTTLVAAFSNSTPVTNDLMVAITGDAKMSIGTGIVTKSLGGVITTNIYGTITPGSVLVAKSGYAVGISTAGNQVPDAAAFSLLTKDDITRLTTISNGQ